MASMAARLDFRLMSLTYLLRDLVRPRRDVLREVTIEPGFCVLDYGCGPGSYILPIAELVGASGRVIAVDVNPLAVRRVKSIATRRHLSNVETICTDCSTGLPDGSVQVALLYDTLHALEDPDGVLRELHRVLNHKGILSLSDHHLDEDEIVTRVTQNGSFTLSSLGLMTYNFQRA
jgi:ubiquinone/menaquinone biosynthesis C-methylase UbiE